MNIAEISNQLITFFLVFPLGTGGPNERIGVNTKNNLFLLLKDACGHSVLPNPKSLI